MCGTFPNNCIRGYITYKGKVDYRLCTALNMCKQVKLLITHPVYTWYIHHSGNIQRTCSVL